MTKNEAFTLLTIAIDFPKQYVTLSSSPADTMDHFNLEAFSRARP